MKLLHSADWHLDSAFVGRTPEQAAFLREQLLRIPDRVTALCKAEGCDGLLLAGDLFDGSYTQESYRAVYTALKELGLPVFISPGNHDPLTGASVYEAEAWPENVHIFTAPALQGISVPELDCRIYGAGYTSMDCPNLLKGFAAQGPERWHIGLMHTDPLQSATPYAPMTTQQIKASGLSYLAAGHIHKGGSFRAAGTLCAWPGCPMGRGYDEPGMKGALLVSFDDAVTAQFLPLPTPRFFDETVDVGENALEAAAALLPPVATEDFYRVTLTGYSAPIDLAAMGRELPHVPNLQLRDRTLPEMDLWSAMNDDTLEGVFFKTLHDGLDTESEALQQHIRLAARISRQILDGQEVVLP